ncbi:MAG: formylglycine-generating enzyme family protein, partial [Armatimonadota bacterium]
MLTFRFAPACGIILLIIPCVISVGAPAKKAGPAKSKPAVAKPAAPTSLKAYTETIQGTLVKFDMVPVPGGTYTFTDPGFGKSKKVTIKPFYIGKTEVTWDEYDVYLNKLDTPNPDATDGADAVSRPSRPYGVPDRGFGHQGYPAIGITYHAAQQYCLWLSAKTGKKYRLPTEAEWEYACRAGKLPAGPIADRALLDSMAWHAENSNASTHPVGTKKANAWGIFDMLGNAGEWCQPVGGGEPVLRGGSYDDSPSQVYPGA